MNIEILSDAKFDIFIGSDFYEKQAPNLGEYFFDSMMSDIESLHIYAGIHMKVFGYHRMLTKRFPYTIYYKKNENKIIIFAVLDCRSDPKSLYKRLY